MGLTGALPSRQAPDPSAFSAFLLARQVEEVLGEEPEVKEQLFEALKQYAAERDVEALAEALPDILLGEEHRQLLDSVRYPRQLLRHRRPNARHDDAAGGARERKSVLVYAGEFVQLPTSGCGICRRRRQ